MVCGSGDDPDRAAHARPRGARHDRARSRPGRGAAASRGTRQAHRHRQIHGRPRRARGLVRGDDPVHRRPRAFRGARPRPGLRLVDDRGRHGGGHPGREHRQLDQVGPADAGPDRWGDPASRRAARAARRPGPGDPSRGATSRAGPHAAAAAGVRSARVRPRVRGLRDRERRPRGGLRRRRPRRRGRVPGRPPGAAVHREPGHDRGPGRRRRRHRDRLAPVPVLRPFGAQARARPRRPGRAGGPGGDRRRVRRQGGVPVGGCPPCRPPRRQGAPARSDDLRATRGHRGDHEAPSGDRPASDRGHPRRPPDRPGHRGRHGRRCLLHAHAGRPVARRAPCRRPVSLPERPDPRPGDPDQHAAQRRLPGLRRAAGRVRRGDAPQPDRRGARPQPARDPPPQRLPRRGTRRRPARSCARAWPATRSSSGPPRPPSSSACGRATTRVREQRAGSGTVPASAAADGPRAVRQRRRHRARLARCRASPAPARSSSPRSPRSS